MFYHLTRSLAEQLLPTLIGKSRQAGWRVELRGTDAARMARLDEALWQGEGFLPHGLAGGPHDALQPVLLTVGGAGDAGKGAGADCLIALDGAAGIHAIACDTDGVDGAAEVAGAVIGPDTLVRARSFARDPVRALDRHDAHGFFAAVGGQVVTGPTLTNVNDFRALLIR